MTYDEWKLSNPFDEIEWELQKEIDFEFMCREADNQIHDNENLTFN